MTASQGFSYREARDLVVALGTAVASYRLYGATHPRSFETRRALIKGIEGTPEMRILVQGDCLAWQGVPFRGNSSFDQVMRCLEARRCDGIEIRRGASNRELAALIEWLCGNATATPDSLSVRALYRGNESRDPYPEFIADFPEFRVPLVLYEETAQSLGATMRAARDGSIDVDQVNEVVRRVASTILADGTAMLGPIHLLRGDSYTWQHSVNVFLITLTVLRAHARTPEELMTFGQAALLHDIGKCRLPSWMLNRPGPLSPDERALVERHPEIGAEIIAGHDGIHPLAAEVAYCHHMRTNGEGYPRTRIPILPGPISALVQVVDIFEALTCWRSYKEPHTFAEAVEILESTKGLLSGDYAVTLLVHTLSGCLPGSQIELTTGERAIVVDAVPRGPHRIIHARLITDPAGNLLEGPIPIEIRDDDSRIAKVISRHGLLGHPIAPGEDEGSAAAHAAVALSANLH